MPKPTTEIISIVNTGASVIIDAAVKPTTDILSIVSAAVQHGGHVTVRNGSSKPASDLIRIGNTGGSHVTIEIN